MVLYYGAVKGWIGLSWCTYAKKMSHKGHPASECFTKTYVEFQWGTGVWVCVRCVKEERKKKLMLIFLAFAARSGALPQAGLSVWTMNRKIDSAKLNMFLDCLFISPGRKYKDREGTKIEGTHLTLCRTVGSIFT